MHRIIVTSIFVIVTNYVASQTLLMSPLSNDEKKRGVVNKYRYVEKGSYGIITLLMFKNGNFEYEMKSFNRDRVSKGKWKRAKDLIILQSNFKTSKVPVNIAYSSDKSMRINGCKFNAVKNLKGEEITDAMIKINNDTIQCLPSYGSCYGNYTSIDSIKITFENGMSSEWIKISYCETKQIVITVEMDFLPAVYFPFDKLKYKVGKNFLKPIK